MEAVSCYEGMKTGAELLTALAKLALEAKKSKKEGLHEIFLKLRGEAVGLARTLDKDLDELEMDLKNSGIDLKLSLRRVDHKIALWNLPKLMALRRYSNKLSRMAAAVKSMYADVEAVFVCAEEQESLSAGINSAYEFRAMLSKKFSEDASISDIIAVMRQAIQSSLKILEG